MSKYENNKGRFTKGNTINVGRKHKPETVEKMKKKQKVVAYWKGKHLSESAKEKCRLGKLGEKHWNWKGGITKLENRIRKTAEYRNWRIAVLKRDDYTCVWCRKRGGNLEVDHIKQFAYYPELRFELSNGRTLCRVCHRITDTFGGKHKA